MHASSILTWLAIAAPSLADVEFTSPSAGATVQGGSTISVKWKDSGNSPPISDLQNYQLFLCAGGNEDSQYIQLTNLVTSGSFSQGNQASGTIQANLGGSTKNAYFLKMISAATGGTVINFSSRFTLTGMTGVFPANVESALSSISGTDGPSTQNNVVQNAANPAAAGGDVPPYSLQTGATRYAPMQRKPGTKITAKSASRQYPTSSFQMALTYLPTPMEVTTITATNTYAVSSMENTAAAQPGPANDMQKFLARWRD